MQVGTARDQEWLTRAVGGLFMFTDATLDFFSAQLWSELFAWNPVPNNPLVWTRSGREVAWFERRLGPYRHISPGDFVYRQPVLARWTCAEDEWERISGLFPQPPSAAFGLNVAVSTTVIELGHLISYEVPQTLDIQCSRTGRRSTPTSSCSTRSRRTSRRWT